MSLTYVIELSNRAMRLLFNWNFFSKRKSLDEGGEEEDVETQRAEQL